MHINPNHVADGNEAWLKSGYTYGQRVIYKNNLYTITAIGYGNLLKGSALITDDNGTEIMVDILEIKSYEGDQK